MTGNALAALAAWVLDRHRLAEVPAGSIPVCTCGYPARLCPYRQHAAELGLIEQPTTTPPAPQPAPLPRRPAPSPRPRPAESPQWQAAWNAFDGQIPPP